MHILLRQKTFALSLGDCGLSWSHTSHLGHVWFVEKGEEENSRMEMKRKERNGEK